MKPYEEKAINIDMPGSTEEAVSELATEVKKTAELSKQKLSDANQKAITYIQDHPWTSLGISLGVGALLGFLCRR